MESIIKWQKGEPKEGGLYLVSLKNCRVDFDAYEGIRKDWPCWIENEEEDIVAWCKLSDIEPYKAE